MKSNQNKTARGCARVARFKESYVRDEGYDLDERCCLEIVRWFCQSFGPDAQACWIEGFLAAEQVWGPTKGPVIAHHVMRVLQAMRISRKSMFLFSAPVCPGCARILTEHERRLIGAIRFARQGRPERAQLQMMLLCEGNATNDAMDELATLTCAMPRYATRNTGICQNEQDTTP